MLITEKYLLGNKARAMVGTKGRVGTGESRDIKVQYKNQGCKVNTHTHTSWGKGEFLGNSCVLDSI